MMKLFVTLILFLFTSPVFSQNLEKRIDAYVKPFVKKKDFSGAILIAKGNKILFRKAYGMANYELQVANTPDDKFGIGSISKQFTAVAILKLTEEGKLSLNDKVSKYIPSYKYSDRITIHQLLTHTSGIQNNLVEDPSELMIKRDYEEIVHLLNKDSLLFEPGTNLQYSNPGYCLLACVVERIVKEPFENFLTSEILQPLRLKNTVHNSNSMVIDKKASGYDPSSQPFGLMPMLPVDYSNIKGAGSIFSTVDDLLKWNLSLHEGKILNDSSYQKLIKDYGYGRGYGVGVYSRSGEKVIGHDGVFNGYNGFLEWYPEHKITITYLGNIRSGFLSQLQGALSAMVFNKTPEDFEYKLANDQSGELENSYDGAYQLFPGFNLYIRHSGSAIQLKGDGGYFTDLVRLDSGDYFYRAMFAKIVFQETDNAKKLIWIDRRNKQYEADKIN